MYVGHARGWYVRDNGKDWWHNGSLPGPTNIMERTSNGMCWEALTYTRTQLQALSTPDQMV